MERLLCFSSIEIDRVSKLCSSTAISYLRVQVAGLAKGTLKSAKCEPTQQILTQVPRTKDHLRSGPHSGVCQLSFVPLLLTNTIPFPFDLVDCFHPSYIYLTIHSCLKPFPQWAQRVSKNLATRLAPTTRPACTR